MDTRTRIVEVVHEDGTTTTAAPRRPNARLFEVLEGPHAGKRGADADLFDLVGALDWDRDTVSVYETGKHANAHAFYERHQDEWLISTALAGRADVTGPDVEL